MLLMTPTLYLLIKICIPALSQYLVIFKPIVLINLFIHSKKYEPIGVADIVQTVKVMQTLKGIADDDEV